MAVAKQTLKLENITKINDILNVIEQEVETNIDFDTMMEYAPALLNINADNIKTDMLPGVAQYCNGVAVYLVDEDEAKQVVNNLFLTSLGTEETQGNTIANEANSNEISSGATVTEDLTIEVLNGTGSDSKLDRAIQQLEAQGYTVAKEGNTNVTEATTIINRTNNSADTESSLIALLGTGSSIMGEDNANVDFTIILGRDY